MHAKILLISLFSIVAAGLANAQEIDWQNVDTAFGRKAAVVSGDAHRYGFPRTDLNVTLDGVVIKPALALGGWIAFKPAHGGVMVMGDLVLLETEINPVMAKLIESGLEITAVHNHLLRATPATFYMHVGGHGDPVKMATAIRTVVILLFAWSIALATNSQSLRDIPARTWLFLVLSGLATGLSWLCYFRALQLGEASKVAPVDKLSVVVAMVLATLFLGEHLTWRYGIGAGLIVAGAVIIAKI